MADLIKISDSVDTESSVIAASSTAVKTVYDLASQAAEAASNAQADIDSKISSTGGTLSGYLHFKGIENIGKIFMNEITDEATFLASKDGTTICALILGGELRRAIIRAYSSDQVATDFYVDGENGYAVCSGYKVVTEGSGNAYAATRTPNVYGVAFSTSTFTFPAGGTWSGFFADESASAAWSNQAGGTTVNLGKAATWRGIISRTA